MNPEQAQRVYDIAEQAYVVGGVLAVLVVITLGVLTGKALS